MRPDSHRTYSEWRRDGCPGVHPADGGDLCPARPGAEVGRRTVSYDNIVGLVLAVLLALFMAAALLFPERF
jgi:K+-transporting ATPase KdpF subunit